MGEVVTLTEAKTKFSEIINRIVYKKERITITKKGKKVAMVIPMDEIRDEREEGLIKARGVLADVDESVDEMVDLIYKTRKEGHRLQRTGPENRRRCNSA
jgi:prevent-host-death family protein